MKAEAVKFAPPPPTRPTDNLLFWKKNFNSSYLHHQNTICLSIYFLFSVMVIHSKTLMHRAKKKDHRRSRIKRWCLCRLLSQIRVWKNSCILNVNLRLSSFFQQMVSKSASASILLSCCADDLNHYNTLAPHPPLFSFCRSYSDSNQVCLSVGRMIYKEKGQYQDFSSFIFSREQQPATDPQLKCRSNWLFGLLAANRTFLKFCSTYFATMLATNLALTRRCSRKLNSSEN